MAKIKHVALLRGVNVSGANKIPMAELRAMCAELGWEEPRTYIQSGNVVFGAAGPAARLEAALEGALTAKLGIEVPVIVRTREEWRRALASNPFHAESAKEPSRVMLLASKKPVLEDAAVRLAGRATLGERIVAAGGGLWVHFPEGAGKTRLTPAVFDRLAGSPVTMRNLNTVRQLAEMLNTSG